MGIAVIGYETIRHVAQYPVSNTGQYQMFHHRANAGLKCCCSHKEPGNMGEAMFLVVSLMKNVKQVSSHESAQT